VSETQTSPLAEASEVSLDEFFSRRPPFDGAALSAMVAEFRRMRVKWQSGEGTAAKKAPKAKKSAPSAIPLGEGDLWASEPEGEPKA
jgi:hypothetical protein